MILRRAAAISLLTLATGPAFGQLIPPAETGDPIVTTSLTAGRVVMRDAATNQILVDPRNLPTHSWSGPGALAPTMTMNAQPSGYDLVFTYHNQGMEPKPVGDLSVGVLTLGDSITYQDFRNTSLPIQTTVGSYITQAWYYPDDLYSPVAVLRNGQYAIGVSLQFPILQYKHDVCVTIQQPKGQFLNGEGGPGWQVIFGLSGLQHNKQMQRPGIIQPGEMRTYVVSVRVTKVADEWIRTLAPYRDFFRWGYGGPKYTRNSKPVMAVGLADQGWISPSNPAGWGFPTRRPDIHGWGPWVRVMQDDLSQWKNLMVWTPTGYYNENTQNNYPFQFTTRWASNPKTSTATDPQFGLPQIKAGGQNLGLWWGRSLQVAFEWNPSVMYPFELNNPSHVAAALAEVDMAVAAGATIIGLDTFSSDLMPIWDQISWLQTMAARAPGVRFVTEPSVCDIIHRITPTWVDGWVNTTTAQTPNDLYRVKNPNYLADFVLPGHETWVGLRWDGWTANFGTPASLARKNEDIEAHAAMGYVPVIFWPVSFSESFNAAESWLTTVPQDLQASASQNPGIAPPPPAPPPVSSYSPSARFYSRAEVSRAIRGQHRLIKGPEEPATGALVGPSGP